MSLKVVSMAAEIERTDEFHLARLLLLLKATGGRTRKPVQGIMKLAKLDFLLRYPNCLVRVLHKVGKASDADSISEEERNTVEAKMIRFRFGPWDQRYRRWLGILVAKGLVQVFLKGKTVHVKLSEAGEGAADQLFNLDEFITLRTRARLINSSVGHFSSTGLKDYIYKLFPEIVEMQWGEHIEL